MDDAIADVQRARPVMTDRARALKGHRNTLVPISRLPPEIFSQIFGECTPRRRLRDLEMLAFSQVCRYWRNLALGNPFLWNEPVLLFPELTSMMLARAQGIPLVVDVCEFQLHPKALSMAFRENPRIRALLLEARGQKIQGMLALLDSVMPMLEVLILRNLSYPMVLWYRAAEEWEAPRLRSLSFHNCFLKSNIKGMGQLVKLEISFNTRMKQYYPVDSAHIFQLMGLCSNLRELKLENVFALLTRTPLHFSDGRIALDLMSLTHLHIVEDILSANQFLSLINAPRLSNTHVNVETHMCPSLMTVLALLVILRRTFAKGAVVIECLDFTVQLPDIGVTKLVLKGGPKREVALCEETDMPFTAVCGLKLRVLSEALGSIIDMLPTHPLRVLKLSIPTDVESPTLWASLCHLPSLVELTLSSEGALFGFLGILPNKADTGSNRFQPDPPPFPALQTLTVQNVPFKDGQITSDGTSDTLRRLADTLKSRRSCDAARGPHRLFLYDCELSDVDEEMVRSILWGSQLEIEIY